MNRVSKKTAARNAAVALFRKQLVQEIGYCELCNHNPRRMRFGQIAWRLDVHEIANGPNRQKALDKRFAVLVVCRACHMDRLSSRAEWPEARQLAALRRSRPRDYSLEKYLETFYPNAPERITEEEVMAWINRPLNMERIGTCKSQ